MTDPDSIEYYGSRERRERELARDSPNPAIAAIHLEMAMRYAELIRVPKNPTRHARFDATDARADAGGMAVQPAKASRSA